MKSKYIFMFIMVICMILLSACSANSAISYYYTDIGMSFYSLDDMEPTTMDFEITPEVAAYIAKGVFINIHGDKYVNERELTVYDNSESPLDLEKYGKFYDVSLTRKEGLDEGEYVAVSKIDGRILKVYSFY